MSAFPQNLPAQMFFANLEPFVAKDLNYAPGHTVSAQFEGAEWGDFKFSEPTTEAIPAEVAGMLSEMDITNLETQDATFTGVATVRYRFQNEDNDDCTLERECRIEGAVAYYCYPMNGGARIEKCDLSGVRVRFED